MSFEKDETNFISNLVLPEGYTRIFELLSEFDLLLRAAILDSLGLR